MITEDYVSFETAKLLKEKGFDECCHVKYKYVKEFDRYLQTTEYVDADFEKYYYLCPTLQMAMKWLEERYGVFCVIRRHGNKGSGFTYSWNCEGKLGLSIGNGGGFKTTTEACEAAIRYCLEILI